MNAVAAFPCFANAAVVRIASQRTILSGLCYYGQNAEDGRCWYSLGLWPSANENLRAIWAGAEEVEDKEFRIKFGQIYLSKPTMTEADGETCVLFPKEARLRNLTYDPTIQFRACLLQCLLFLLWNVLCVKACRDASIGVLRQ